MTWDDEARCEFNCSALRYAKVAGADIANRFVEHVETAISQARSGPERFRLFDGRTRRVRVDHFPFAVVYWYDQTTESIHIVAIAHLHRQPGYWRERIAE